MRRHLRNRRLALVQGFVLSLVLLGSLTVTGDVRSNEPEESSGSTTWAILIGVEKYEKAPQLMFTSNDVRRLADTLVVRGGVARNHILQMTDMQEDPAFQPRKAALMKNLTAWLAKPAAQDSVIVYFSGHGFRDTQGKMYLAPLDCDPANPEPTGIAVEWFRSQLAGCRGKFKLLLLDSCHAGSEKGDASPSVDANSLGAKFDDLERVVTIASCKASEKSLIWGEKEQSLFSYWLNQGLRGHADREPNGKVDIDELYEFVSRNVKRTADVKFSRSQTPIRIVRSGVDGIPDVLTLRPQSLKGMLADMAEQLAYGLEEKKLAKVGVLEFLALSQTGDEGLGGRFGLLGKFCAEELERQLQDRGSGKFSVVDRRRLQEGLSSNKFQLKDLGSAHSLNSLSKSVGGLPVLAVGSFISRDGRLLRLQCKLQQTGDDTELGVTTGGTAALNESEWAMLGRSTVVRPEDRRPDYQPTDLKGEPSGDSTVDAQVIRRMEQRTDEPGSHPFQDPTFSRMFSVTMTVNDQPRKGEFRGNDYFIPVIKGEKYKLVIENRSGETVVMRLLVDGLNTLPEKEANTKGIAIEGWGQHVDLNDARSWILDPKGPELKGGPPVWTVSGFATATGKSGVFREFVVVDAQQSLAARQAFTDEIGLITVALYKPKAGARGAGVGTAAGGELAADLTERHGITAGNLIAVVHLRYIDGQMLAPTR